MSRIGSIAAAGLALFCAAGAEPPAHAAAAALSREDALWLERVTQDLRSGFMARLAGVVSGAAPIAFTDSLPVCFRGSADIPNISLKGVGKVVFDTRQVAILSALYSGHHLQPEVEDGLELRRRWAGRCSRRCRKRAATPSPPGASSSKRGASDG